MLTKKEESLIRALRTRHGRRDSSFCLCDGFRSGSEILALHPELVSMIILREGTECRLALPRDPVILPEKEFEELAPTVNSQGILILAQKPPLVPPDAPLRDPYALVLDKIGDPGNFGTILRTARATGLHEIWLTKGSADPFSDKVLRTASGAQFALGIRVVQDIPELVSSLRNLGIRNIYRTLPASGSNVFLEEALFDRSAVVFGCESLGVSEIPGSVPLNIPMPGDAESLNVAQAATVVMFEYVRRCFSGK